MLEFRVYVSELDDELQQEIEASVENYLASEYELSGLELHYEVERTLSSRIVDIVDMLFDVGLDYILDRIVLE